VDEFSEVVRRPIGEAEIFIVQEGGCNHRHVSPVGMLLAQPLRYGFLHIYS
jgi:hypothetical protein